MSSFTNFEIQNQLSFLVIRAVADFKFPNIGLEYAFDAEINPDTEEPYGYYFLNELTQKEHNVILARMKQYWVEFQISQERLFANAYFDKDVRLHSPGNMIDKLIKMFVTFKNAADFAEYNYGRVSKKGDPTIGDINE